MGGTRFMVQWEEHPSHLATRLGQLLEHQTLVDVTLMCNTHTLRVHRAVLAACSPYFESILQRQLGAHPLIVLKDMQFSVLKSLIEFMYCGETSVTEDNLGALLQAAKFFQVKGLSSMTREALGLPASPAKPAPTPTPVPINGDFAKKVPQVRTPASTKKIGMQTTLVSTAEVMNKQLIAGNTTTTTTANSLSQTRLGSSSDSSAVKVSTAQGVSTISTDTAQLLLNLSGAEGTLPQSVSSVETPPVQVISRGIASTVSTPSRPMLQMSSRNVRLTNLRGTNMMKIDAKSLAEKSKLTDATASAHQTDDAPRRRGRPLKKQINVMFQEKVISDAEVALQKEADASRLALEALKREMNTGDPGNAAAVEAELVEADENRSQEHIEEAMTMKTDEEMTEDTHTLVASEDNCHQSEASTAEVVYQVTADGQVVATGAAGNDANAAGNVASYMEALKEAGLPTDLPILLDSGDGSYVTVNEEVLMNICNGGVIHYQVAEGNLVQGTDGQVVVQEGENETESVQEFLQEDAEQPKETEKASESSVIQMAAETKPVNKRNRVVTPSGGCGFTTARQIVKASMDKYRQEQAGVRKFVVKEMQAAELILEPGDEGVTLSQGEEHIVQEEGHDGIQEGHEQVEDEEQQQLVSTTTVESSLVQTGAGQVQALLQTFSEDGESQQEMVYLVTENADEVIASGNFGDGSHSFVVTDGTTVQGGHTFSIADGNIVVQQGQEEAEMSVEQALEAMMGGSDTSNHDTSNSNQQSAVDADSMRLVLGDPDDKSNVLLGGSSGDKTEDTLAILTDNAKLEDTLLDDLNDDDDETPSKDIPLAVGLLPLRTALERIQATPEHQPRKTRSSSLTGDGNKGGKRKSDSESESLEKKARSEEAADSDGITDQFDAEEENSSSYDVETSLGVITEDGLKNVP
ncbi:Longitudinals lacking protein, isoforms J/P/Q/S/Z [Frankliniella fusca]|uniref:Longitudinals lacking protein, isoforms J/P/Q/S/Z n=1 Tax=Frankliniella fusca TaxID=407009 RepID=A0AAE1HWK8_9NEOP|nr:Longitudinals lacking protein, isoforms J/P/Q/S/Z [Frankliniella fusca]